MIHASQRSWRKLPVYDTIGETYLFVVREFATIVGVSWLPLAITAIATYFADEYVALLGAKVLAVALGAIVAVALHRVILFGDRTPKTWFGVPWLSLRFGEVEALFALPPFLMYASIVLLNGAGVSLEWHATGGPAVMMFFVVCIIIYFIGRFILIFPIAVIEHRFDFAQAWALSYANVWRMVIVWIVVTPPPYIVLALWQWLLLKALSFTRFAMTAEQFDGSLLEVFASTIPMSIVFGALCVAILSYTYKALAGFSPDARLKAE